MFLRKTNNVDQEENENEDGKGRILRLRGLKQGKGGRFQTSSSNGMNIKLRKTDLVCPEKVNETGEAGREGRIQDRRVILDVTFVSESVLVADCDALGHWHAQALFFFSLRSHLSQTSDFAFGVKAATFLLQF